MKNIMRNMVGHEGYAPDFSFGWALSEDKGAGFKRDFIALQGDWKNVGKALQNGIEKIGEEAQAKTEAGVG